MITFLKKYANDSFEKLVNEIHWMDLPFRLKAIFSKLPSGGGDSRPYKVYTALLTQSGTDAPVATVLENTLRGEVVWSYTGVGAYIGTLINAFPENKYFCPCPTSSFGYDAEVNNGGGGSSYTISRANDDSINVATASDDVLIYSPIKIEVYN